MAPKRKRLAFREGDPTPPADLHDTGMEVETALLADLKPHPRNYRDHPADQIAHLIASINEHGVYRPVVTAEDGTILAGHGLVLALQSLNYTHVQIVRVPIKPDDPRALKLLVADNEISHLVGLDDNALAELLTEVRDFDLMGLLGTGFNDASLADLTARLELPPEPEAPGAFRSFDESISTEHKCPKCGYAWSGKSS